MRPGRAGRGQDAPMDREPGDPVHDGLRRDIDRNRRGRPFEQGLKRLDAPLGQEQRLDSMPGLGQKRAQNYFALGDEPPLAADEVAFADGQVVGHPRIGGVVDGQNRGHGTLRGFARFLSCSQGTAVHVQAPGRHDPP